MSGRTEIERALDGFFAEGPETVNDQALVRTLDAIDRTKQRRGMVASWRFSLMITLPRIAAAALVAVIVVGGAAYLLGSHSSVGVPATPQTTAPASSPVATRVIPTADVSMNLDTATWTQFTTSRYGYTVAWPNTAVWIHSPATEDWAGQTSAAMWASATDAPWVDKFFNQTERLTMTAVATRIPSGTTEEAFIDAYMTPDGSAPATCPEPAKAMTATVIDGHPARLTTRCDDQAAFVAVGSRMYVFSISNKNEVPFLQAYLTTVRLPVDTSAWLPFTSAFYGFTVSHPSTWTVAPGTGHWSLTNQSDPAEDWLRDASGKPDFEGFESKVPAGMTAASLIQAYVADAHGNDCYAALLIPTTVDGHAATLANGGCSAAFSYAEATVVIGNRVWFFDLHGPDRSLIVPFLSTVTIDPTKVVD